MCCCATSICRAWTAWNLLRRVHERPNPPEVIMLTGQGTIETAVEAMKLGAYDYLTKPYSINELDVRVRQACEKRNLRVDNQRLRAQIERKTPLPEIVSQSRAMAEAIRLVERVAPSEASVLITGESGTGKELIAQAIHRLSSRAGGAFIDLNCAAFQESLLESELFGYEAGAFSGAKARKLGLIELADGGTLFLDEVTELPASLQAKLLRAIETRTFFRVGGVRKVEVNVRIVAATNRNLDTIVSDGTFRADLLYRINSFQIHLAPLRERPDDIEPLMNHMLKQLGGAAPPAVSADALERLRSYQWPGNVRQLRNCLERAVLLSNEGVITANELPPEVARLNGAMPYVPAPDAALSERQRQRQARCLLLVIPDRCATFEKQQIIAALERSDGIVVKRPRYWASRLQLSIAVCATMILKAD